MLVNPSSVQSTVGAKAAAQAMAANLISVEVRTPADNVRLTRMLFRIGINPGDVLLGLVCVASQIHAGTTGIVSLLGCSRAHAGHTAHAGIAFMMLVGGAVV